MSDFLTHRDAILRSFDFFSSPHFRNYLPANCLGEGVSANQTRRADEKYRGDEIMESRPTAVNLNNNLEAKQALPLNLM
jgi:hypothetical protein